MLRPLPLLVALLGLISVSCSSTGKLGGFRNLGGYTKADLATMRMRDLNPLANRAPVVQVQQSTLAAISSERMAQLQESRGFLWFKKPVNWNPPTLPEGSYSNDGSLLPPKSGTLATINADGFLPKSHVASANPRLTAEGRAQDFSIE
jgi:hypothetical protein